MKADSQPVSLATPTKKEALLTKKLQLTLVKNYNFEDEQEASMRADVVNKMDLISREFVQQVAMRKRIPLKTTSPAQGKLYVIGSYALRVHSKESDIDFKLITPRYVKDEDMFNELYKLLKANPEVTDLMAKPQPRVPILSMKFCGIPVDISISSLDMEIIPPDLDLSDRNLIESVNKEDIGSILGIQSISLVHKKVKHLGSYRIFLQSMKLWAGRRGIYGGQYGYLSGVILSIMTVKITQKYPNATPSVLVREFFKYYRDYDWNAPLLLDDIELSPYQLSIWDPREPAEIGPYKKMKAFLISSMYPAIPATINMKEGTKNVIVGELERGFSITREIFKDKANWEDLFEPVDIFSNYRNFVQVVLTTVGDEEGHESKANLLRLQLKRLAQLLDEGDNNIELAIQYPGSFTVNKQAISWEEALEEHSSGPSSTKGWKKRSHRPRKNYYSTSLYIALNYYDEADEEAAMFEKYVKGFNYSSDVYAPIMKFKRLTKSLLKGSSSSRIIIRELSAENLPDHVFDSDQQSRNKGDY